MIEEIKFSFIMRLAILFGKPLRLNFHNVTRVEKSRNEKGELCFDPYYDKLEVAKRRKNA